MTFKFIDGNEPEEYSVGDVLKILGWLLVGLLVADFLVMIFWALSGQVPPDGFFLGRVSYEIIRMIIK